MRSEDRRDEVVDARVLVRERGGHGGLDLRLHVRTDRGDGIVVELAARAQALLEPWQRVPALPLLDEGRITDVRQVRPHRVLHAPERLQLEERRAVARPGADERRLDGVLHCDDVVAVHDGARHPVARRACGNVLDGALRAPVGRERELVVLADEDDRQPPRRREVHPLVGGALARGAVTEEGDHRLAGSPQRGGKPGPARMRHTGPDDAVAAEDVEREVGDVHRAAEPLAVAGALAEHLGHHPAQVGAGGDQVAVRAVVADEVVALAHHPRRADGDRLLADAAVGGAEDDTLLEQLLGAVLEDADQPHPPVLLGQRRPAGGSLPLRGGRVSRHEAAAGGTRRRTRRDRVRRGSCRPCSARSSSRPAPRT